MGSALAARALAEKMKTKRMIGRTALLDEGRNAALMLGRIPGAPYSGKDAEGQPFPTKAPNNLKMRLLPAGVEIKFRREESGKIDEVFAEGMRIPRKSVTVKTSIFRAVRSLKHVCEGYEAEFKRRDRVLAEIEKINAELSLNGAKMDGAQIHQIEERIDAVMEGISQDVAAVKKLGEFKIDEVFGYLEPARYLTGFEKTAMIAAACAKLVAFRNRYGEWRDRQAAGSMAYNKLRECSLRKERDNFLSHLLNGWADFIEKYQYAAPKMWKRDLENAKKIRELITLVAADHSASIARLVEIGRNLKDKGVENSAKKELRKAYRGLKDGKFEDAIMYLGRADRILEENKPWHVLGELEKTGDAYMEKTAGRIRKATELLMGKNHVVRGAQLFREAAQKI